MLLPLGLQEGIVILLDPFICFLTVWLGVFVCFIFKILALKKMWFKSES